jgi:hypothetical protein
MDQFTGAAEGVTQSNLLANFIYQINKMNRLDNILLWHILKSAKPFSRAFRVKLKFRFGG